MKDTDLKASLTVEQWGAWLRYASKYSIKKTGNEWPEYDVNEFMHILDIVIEREQTLPETSKQSSPEESKQLDLPLGPC